MSWLRLTGLGPSELDRLTMGDLFAWARAVEKQARRG